MGLLNNKKGKNAKVIILNQLDELKTIKETEMIETVENIETVETVENIKTVETVENIETVETVENIETVETVENIENIETVETVENIETVETVENIETVQPTQNEVNEELFTTLENLRISVNELKAQKEEQAQKFAEEREQLQKQLESKKVVTPLQMRELLNRKIKILHDLETFTETKEKLQSLSIDSNEFESKEIKIQIIHTSDNKPVFSASNSIICNSMVSNALLLITDKVQALEIELSEIDF